jgi:ketosteroid isomerase-like protein
MRYYRNAVVLTFLLTLVLAAGAEREGSELSASKTVDDFTAAYNGKDIDKLAALYAADAIMVSESGVAQGRDAIKLRLNAGIQGGNSITALHPESDDTSGSLSFSEGVADVIHGGQHLQRHYLVIVKKVGTADQIVVHYSLPAVAKTP